MYATASHCLCVLNQAQGFWTFAWLSRKASCCQRARILYWAHPARGGKTGSLTLSQWHFHSFPPLSLSLTHTLPLSESGNGWVSALLLLVSKTECTLNMNANELSNKTWKLQNLKTSIKVRPRGCEMWGGGDNRGRKLSNSMGNCDFNCTSSLVGLR